MTQQFHPAWHNWLARETFTNLRDLKVESSSLSVGVIPFASWPIVSQYLLPQTTHDYMYIAERIVPKWLSLFGKPTTPPHSSPSPSSQQHIFSTCRRRIHLEDYGQVAFAEAVLDRVALSQVAFAKDVSPLAV
jgi:hypothetical protein